MAAWADDQLPRSVGGPPAGPVPVAPARSAESAAWLKERLEPWGAQQGTRVSSVVPGGFAAYARVEKDDAEESLSRQRARKLGRTLDMHESAGLAGFAVWHGYAHSAIVEGREVYLDRLDAPRLKLPSRTYLLFEGPLADIEKFVWAGEYQAPDIWWPDHHRWCVGSDTDLVHAYVGATEEVVEAVMARFPDAERMDPEYRIDLDPKAGA